MSYTIRITQNAEASAPSGSPPPFPGEISLEDLATAILALADPVDINALLAALPTEDPLADGEFYLNSGVVTISAGAA